jgi:hypothetical protein
LGKTASLNLEGFYTARELPARKASAWFSKTPPLPARNFTLYGLAMLLNAPYVSLSADWAWSEVFLYGKDLYANLGLRVNNTGSGAAGNSGTSGNNTAGKAGQTKKAKPRWQLSLTADGAGSRYTGSDGASPGAGFRTGGKFEWQQDRIGLFRVHTNLSGPGFTASDSMQDLIHDFNRSASGLYYRPPATTLPFRVSRISVSANRDTREAGHIKDNTGMNVSLAANPQGIVNSITAFANKHLGTGSNLPGAGNTGSLALNLSGSMTGSPIAGGNAGSSAGGTAGLSEEIPPWPVPQGPYLLESAKAGGQLSWSGPVDLGPFSPQRNLQLKAGLDYTMTATGPEEEAANRFKESWDLSLAATLRGKRGRFGIKLLYPDLPLTAREEENTASLLEAWKLTLSWQMELK